MEMRELCSGPLPLDFLKQLETLHLESCFNLTGMLLKDGLDLGKLKFIHLAKCRVTSLFQIK